MGRHSISSQISGIILNILKGRNLIFSFFFLGVHGNYFPCGLDFPQLHY